MLWISRSMLGGEIDMKYKLTFMLGMSFFIVACEDCVPKKDGPIASTFIDIRCQKFIREAREKGIASGVCYKRPENSRKIWYAEEVRRLHPDPEACQALYDEADKKCEALPDDPDSIIQTSGSAFYTPNRRVFLNGKWVKICRE